MASVTMKGGMANRVIIRPEKPPTAPHTTMANKHPSTMPPVEALIPPAWSRINPAASTADSAIRLPTDKSMPPVIMTKVMPMATMAITAIWLAIFRRFSDFRKLGHR